MLTEQEENHLCRKSCASFRSPCTYFFIYTVLHFCVGVASSPHLQLFFSLVVEFETKTKYTDPFIKANLSEDRGGKEVETAG